MFSYSKTPPERQSIIKHDLAWFFMMTFHRLFYMRSLTLV